MTALGPALVRELATFSDDDHPVVSCYLDVDGRRRPRPADVVRAFDQLTRTTALPAADVERIRARLRQGIDRSVTRGLALFSCAGAGWFETVEVALPLADRVALGPHPVVRPLEQLLQEHEGIGVLLVDHASIRLVVSQLGLLEELHLSKTRAEALGEGRSNLVKTRQEHVEAETALQHARAAAQVAAEHHAAGRFVHLVVSGAQEVTGQVIAALGNSLRDAVVHQLQLPVGSSVGELRSVVLATEEMVAHRRQEMLVGRLRDEIGAKGRGVSGVKATLAEIDGHTVDTLLVSPSTHAEGWRCAACGHLALLGPRCPRCHADMVRVDDVIDEAVDAVLAAGARVVVCDRVADLDVLGGIGALLRYRR